MQQYRCSRCNTSINYKASFCGNCGTELNWSSYEPPQSRKGPAKWIAIVELAGIIILILILLNNNSVLKSYQSDVLYWKDKANSYTTQIAQLETNKSDLEANIQDLEEKLKGTLPYKNSKGSYIKRNNAEGTHNPAWAELKAFIQQDNTDKLPYIDGTRVCADFAEMLHNNAEVNGIRAGIVVIHFKDEGFLVPRKITIGSEVYTIFEISYPHALNVFYTTDYGLIYIDCQGPAPEETTNCNYDEVAYIEVGHDLGEVDINTATSFAYSFYENHQAKYNKYNNTLETYNSHVIEYNNYVRNRVFTEGTSEYYMIVDWEHRLQNEEQLLDTLGNQLPDCYIEPLGIVDNIELYW